MINYYFEKQPTSVLGEQQKQWLNRCVTHLNLDIHQLNFIFVDDPYIHQLNKNELGHDYPTDILTFDYRENVDNPIYADICISIDSVKNNAVLYAVSYQNELKRVMIHGILHLIGYDDHTEEDVAKIRNEENKLILL